VFCQPISSALHGAAQVDPTVRVTLGETLVDLPGLTEPQVRLAQQSVWDRFFQRESEPAAVGAHERRHSIDAIKGHVAPRGFFVAVLHGHGPHLGLPHELRDDCGLLETAAIARDRVELGRLNRDLAEQRDAFYFEQKNAAKSAMLDAFQFAGETPFEGADL
jgi:hypothetical protein